MAAQNGIHDGHRERLKKRFDQVGEKGFEEHTILELLLFYAIPRKDTNAIAHRLINTFGSLEEVFKASREELMCVDEVGESTARFIQVVAAAHSVGKQEQLKKKKRFKSVEEIGEFSHRMLKGKREESMLVIGVGARGEMLLLKEVSNKMTGKVMVGADEISVACTRKGVSSIVLAHNHPSGMSMPSVDDLVMTKKMIDFLGTSGVTVLDHFVVTDEGFYSMKAHNLL